MLADLRPAALLALRAPLPVGTSAAHLAFRPKLHPVLARPLRARGSFTLRPLLRHLLSFLLRVLDFAILVEGHSHVRPPNRRHPSPRPEECSARHAPATPRQNVTERAWTAIERPLCMGFVTGKFSKNKITPNGNKRIRPVLSPLNARTRVDLRFQVPKPNAAVGSGKCRGETRRELHRRSE